MIRGVTTRSLLVFALAGMSTSPAAAIEVIALGVGATSNQIVRFDSATPGTIDGPTPVTGLGGGDTLVGIDSRPATGDLIGLAVNGNTATLYEIDPGSGAATLIGPAIVNTIAGATAYGIDFNPTVDRLRVANNLASDGAGGNANNFRLNPNTGGLTAVDPDLDFTGLPGGNANAPEVAVAYANNVEGATTTTLFGIVSGGDRLVQNGGVGPGFPTLQNVGVLGVDTSNNAGFDIGGSPEQGFAILEVGGVSGFYAIDLASGAATLVGNVGNGTIDFGSMALSIQTSLLNNAAVICGQPPSAAAEAALRPSIVPDAPDSDADCPALCRKWTSTCRGLVGAVRSCWKNAGNKIASIRNADCNTLSVSPERKSCRDVVKAEKDELKSFLAIDGQSGLTACAGTGLAECILSCS
jgi:hypothetical protein